MTKKLIPLIFSVAVCSLFAIEEARAVAHPLPDVTLYYQSFSDSPQSFYRGPGMTRWGALRGKCGYTPEAIQMVLSPTKPRFGLFDTVDVVLTLDHEKTYLKNGDWFYPIKDAWNRYAIRGKAISAQSIANSMINTRITSFGVQRNVVSLLDRQFNGNRGCHVEFSTSKNSIKFLINVGSISRRSVASLEQKLVSCQ